MENIEPVKELRQLFENHGLSCSVKDEWVRPNDKLPAIRARWYPRETNGELEVQVFIREGILIEECFGGIGEPGQAYVDALHNFTVNSFHVFLAALWEKNEPEQVTTEEWNICGKSFTAYIGNFGTRASTGVSSDTPKELFPAIEAAVKNETLEGEIHWVRTFFCNLDGEQTFEALLDNEDWEAGIHCLKSVQWLKCDGYYSLRNFMLLKAKPAALSKPRNGWSLFTRLLNRT